jgi:hypothetical protein
MTFLSFLINFGLKSTFSDTSIAIPACFRCLLAWHTVVHPFTQGQQMSLPRGFSWVCRKVREANKTLRTFLEGEIYASICLPISGLFKEELSFLHPFIYLFNLYQYGLMSNSYTMCYNQITALFILFLEVFYLCLLGAPIS